MKKIGIPFTLAAIILGAVFAYWSATHYLIHTQNGLLIVPKRYITWSNTFLDIREWQKQDFNQHPPLRKAREENGYGSLLKEPPSGEKTSPPENAGREKNAQDNDTSSAPFSDPSEEDTPKLQAIQRKIRHFADTITQWAGDLTEDSEKQSSEPSSKNDESGSSTEGAQGSE